MAHMAVQLHQEARNLTCEEKPPPVQTMNAGSLSDP